MNDLKLSKRLIKLFFSTLFLSTFTFGGGYVIVTLLKKRFVDELHWIDDEEMVDLVAIAQSSPGAIAVNGAIIVGFKLAGFPGVLVSVLGAILPPFVILSVISGFYDAFKSAVIIRLLLEGMKAGVCAVIFSVVFDMAFGVMKQKRPFLIVLMGLAFIANYFMKVSVILLILITVAIGVAVSLFQETRKQQGGEKR